MAQVCGGAPYDHFRESMATGLSLLERIADAWAMSGEHALAFDAVLALMCRVLLPSRYPEEFPLSLAVWLEHVDSPEVEMERRTRWLRGCSPDEALMELSEVLAIAGESWCLGDPTFPPPERVLHAMAMILYRHRLLRRRPPPRLG